MAFRRFYLGCLAHASYFLADGGEAAVVDPQRDVDQYVAEAETSGARLKYVFLTHLHADFVSGHCELAARTGAEVVLGTRAGASFPHIGARDGEEFRVGRYRIRVLETPGHTMDSICILVRNPEDPQEPVRLLSGDTLFMGDVGRPDLAASAGIDAETLAGLLYDSLHEKILSLDDEVEVCPAHGAGSLCGRNISSQASSSLGEQRRTNHALQPMSRGEFIERVTTGLCEIPAYFSRDVAINRQGAVALDSLAPPEALPPDAVAARMREGWQVLDVRDAVEFGEGHVPGSVNVGLGGQFATWAGCLLSPEVPLILVTSSPAATQEAVMRLARVGFENARGVLDGGVAAWKQAGHPVACIPQITVDELQRRLESPASWQVVDVRRPGEYESGHVPGAVNLSLSEVDRKAQVLEADRPTLVICQGGYRSSAACSLLARHGFSNLANVTGGTGAWIKAGHPVETDRMAVPAG